MQSTQVLGNKDSTFDSLILCVCQYRTHTLKYLPDRERETENPRDKQGNSSEITGMGKEIEKTDDNEIPGKKS